MEDDIVSSPIFPVLFIVFTVASITFMATANLKLSIGLSFFSTMSLIILLRHLDSRAEKTTRNVNADLPFREGTTSKKDEYRTRTGLRERITTRIHRSYRKITAPISTVYRSIGTVRSYLKFIFSIIAAVLTALIFSVVLNLVQ